MQVPLVLWRSVEANCLIIVTSLPTIGPSLRFGRQVITKLTLFVRRPFALRRQSGTGLTPWSHINRGLASLPSEQTDLRLSRMMPAPAPFPESFKRLPRNESTEILRTVDIQTSIEEVTPDDHHIGDSNLGLPTERPMFSKYPT